MKLPQQFFSVLRGVDKHGCAAVHQGIRVAKKGHRTGFAAMRLRQIPAGRQQRLMTQMHPIKKPQGVDCFFFHHVVS